MSVGENRALAEADTKMQEVLGDCYKGHLGVRAHALFLALAECFDPNAWQQKHFANTKEKFLKAYTKETLLKKGGWHDLHDLLNQVVSAQQKIIHENKCTKAAEALMACAKTLYKSSHEMATKTRELQVQAQDSTTALKRLPQKTHLNLKKDLENALKDFKNVCENEVYGYIATNVSNNDVERKAKEVIGKHAKVFEKSATAKIEAQVEAFKEALNAELKAFSLRAGAIETQQVGVDAKMGDFDTDSGVDWWKLGGAGALGGMLAFDLANFWNPLGWIGTAVTIGAALTLAYNALKKLWDDDFKKSEQRKAFNEQLNKIVEKMRSDIGFYGWTQAEIFKKVEEEIKKKSFIKYASHAMRFRLLQELQLQESLKAQEFLKAHQSTLAKIYQKLEETIEKIIQNLESNLKERKAVCVRLEELAMDLGTQADKLQLQGGDVCKL